MRKFSFDAKHAFDVAIGLELITGLNEFSTAGFSGEALTIDLEADITTIPLIDLNNTIPNFAHIWLPNNAGEAMEISSDDLTDTGDIQIFALGPGGVLLEPIVITLQGTTPVAFPAPNLCSRINFMRSFSPAGFAGTITIRAAGAGNTFANMLARYQNMSTCHYCVPANTKGLLKTATGSMRKQGGTDTAMAMLIHTKPFEFEKFYHPFGFGLQRSGATTVPLVNAYPEAINGPFDVAMSANASAAGAEAAGRIAGLIIDV